MPDHISLLYFIIFLLVLGPEVLHLMFGTILKGLAVILAIGSVLGVFILACVAWDSILHLAATAVGPDLASGIDEFVIMIVLFVGLPLLYADSRQKFEIIRSLFQWVARPKFRKQVAA